MRWADRVHRRRQVERLREQGAQLRVHPLELEAQGPAGGLMGLAVDVPFVDEALDVRLHRGTLADQEPLDAAAEQVGGDAHHHDHNNAHEHLHSVSPPTEQAQTP